MLTTHGASTLVRIDKTQDEYKESASITIADMEADIDF